MQKTQVNYLRDLTREPPERTTVKASLSREILLDKSAAYSASDTARSSSVSNTLTFPLLFGVTISAMDAFVAPRLKLEETEFNLRELKAAPTARKRDVKGMRGGDRVRDGLGRAAERARQEAAMRRIYREEETGECRVVVGESVGFGVRWSRGTPKTRGASPTLTTFHFCLVMAFMLHFIKIKILFNL